VRGLDPKEDSNEDVFILYHTHQTQQKDWKFISSHLQEDILGENNEGELGPNILLEMKNRSHLCPKW